MSLDLWKISQSIFILKKVSRVMTSLGGCPPWAVLKDMIDAADSDRNGQVIL